MRYYAIGRLVDNEHACFSVRAVLSAVSVPCLAQTVLKSEPLVLAPYEIAYVQDASCAAGKVLKVTGAIRGLQPQEGLRGAGRAIRPRWRWRRHAIEGAIRPVVAATRDGRRTHKFCQVVEPSRNARATDFGSESWRIGVLRREAREPDFGWIAHFRLESLSRKRILESPKKYRARLPG